MPKITTVSQNVRALLDTIAYSEGTDNNVQPTMNEGYDVLVGGELFTDYSHHPNKLIKVRDDLYSTAAGRYQILYRYWKDYEQSLNLLDFSPLSQDLYAINQFRERGALNLINQGDFEPAIRVLSKIWASLPGATYGQPVQKMQELKAIYIMHNGTYRGET